MFIKSITRFLLLAMCLNGPLGMAETLSISRLGAGDGVVIDILGEINCGTECVKDYPPHTQVQLTATPDDGAGFLSWSAGACAGRPETCAFETTDHPQMIAAYFTGVAIAAGGYHTLALDSQGIVSAWGKNDAGQLGDGTKETRIIPLLLDALPPVDAISAGYQHSVVLDHDGVLWAWGNNTKGQLGDGTFVSRTTPVQVTEIGGIITLSTGYEHTVALGGDGTVFAWGANTKGQLGDGTTISRNTPTKITGVDRVIAIATGNAYTVALRNDGTVWTWGDNTVGQLGEGNPSAIPRTTPAQIANLTGVVAIDTGARHTVVLKDNGEVWAWGDNSKGQLGDGSKIGRSKPVKVKSGLTGVRTISAGYTHTAVLTYEGTVWTWGDNWGGQLGDPVTILDRAMPQPVEGLAEIRAVTAGAGHTAVIAENGAVFSFGSDKNGELGDGSQTNSATPVQAIGLNLFGELPPPTYTVTATADTGGTLTPTTQSVIENETAIVTITPNTGYIVNTATGCGGKRVGNTYTTGAITADCTITVTFKKNIVRYPLTVKKTGTGFGTVSGGGSFATGAIVNLMATAASGSKFIKWAPSPCASRFTMPANNLTCTATFTANIVKYPITVKKTGTGSGTVSGAGSYLPNATVKLTATAAIGSVFSGWKPSPCAATFKMPPKALVCTATFTLKPQETHTVTASATTVGGTITPSPQVVKHGMVTIFSVLPEMGYVIGTVTGCNGTLSENIYTTGTITADCTITATFEPIILTYTVTAIAGENGSVAPSSQTVNSGETASVIVVAKSGYTASASGCGGALSGVSYTTAVITGDCTVTAMFTANTVVNDNMVRIKAGCFLMGSPESEPERNPWEVNETQHQVCIDNDFYMGKYEVTFEEYDAFCDATGCAKPDDGGWGRGKRPVINVSWDDATAYAAWLSKKTGLKYRLPTEAEWEYAARAGTTTPFWTGACVTVAQANFWDTSAYGNCPSSNTYRNQTLEVGTFPANPWGLYDTMGSVWEWTCSLYDSSYGGSEKICTTTGISGNRVLRGGSWSGYPDWVRSANRNRRTADFRNGSIGFRLSRSLF